jgi:hypothetical protein
MAAGGRPEIHPSSFILEFQKSQWAFLERAMPLVRALLRLLANWWMWAASTMVPEARVTRR